MDSRAYVFIFPLRTNADIPNDFAQQVRDRTFDTGVFLPQDDSNWFTRPIKYPARLLLLEGRSFQIIPHPSSEQQPVEIDLEQLLQIETGTVLLHGWLRFTTPDGVQEIVYNTRASRPLEKFLVLLRRQWLGGERLSQMAGTAAYGEEIDVKFKNCLHFELHPDELAIARYFEASARVEKKVWFFRRVNWRSGNLILLTSMDRLLWITEQYKGRRELYASVSFSAPTASVRETRLETVEDRQYLAISFSSGSGWRIPIDCAPEEGLSFSQTLSAATGGLKPVNRSTLRRGLNQHLKEH